MYVTLIEVHFRVWHKISYITQKKKKEKRKKKKKFGIRMDSTFDFSPLLFTLRRGLVMIWPTDTQIKIIAHSIS